MRTSNLKDYELIDTSNGERLERWGDIVLIRPDPQIIWDTPNENPLWYNANAHYSRSNKGGGHWDILKPTPDTFNINYHDLVFRLKLMGFKHTGIFPEQETNWELIYNTIKSSNKQLNVLNMFAYTGAASLVAARAGAKVCHVDASKGMVTWARENQKASHLEDAPIRWIVDDCVKFAKREQRRGNKYDIIIIDPPSYGRGPCGEVWKLEKELYSLVSLLETLLSDDARLFVLNSYTTGLSPSIMEYLLSTVIQRKRGGQVSSDEIGLNVTDTNKSLAAGSTALWLGEK